MNDAIAFGSYYNYFQEIKWLIPVLHLQLRLGNALKYLSIIHANKIHTVKCFIGLNTGKFSSVLSKQVSIKKHSAHCTLLQKLFFKISVLECMHATLWNTYVYIRHLYIKYVKLFRITNFYRFGLV